jgi:hypothetical protein
MSVLSSPGILMRSCQAGGRGENKKMGRSMNWHLKLPSGNAASSYISFAKASHLATLNFRKVGRYPNVCLEEGNSNLCKHPNDYDIQVQCIGVIRFEI